MNARPHDAAPRTAWVALILSTTAFTIAFAAWMLYGVLVTFLINNGLYRWTPAQMGVLLGVPVLTGSLFRLPLGIATDRWGGRPVNSLLLILAAVPMFLVGYCDSFWGFLLAGLGFGFTGTGFAVGIAFTSVWFPKRLQGTALGIFGAGNAGAALTLMGAPALLNLLTDGGQNLEGWRHLPRIYAVVLLLMGVAFWLGTTNRVPPGAASKTMAERLSPLKHVRVWRFGLYYFFVFGGFVALAGWLMPYYVNVYGMSVVTAGLLTSVNTLPSGVIRALGGWMSDLWGGRVVMYWVLGVCAVCCALLVVPQMDIHSPGSGVAARFAGVVTEIRADEVVVESPRQGLVRYPLRGKAGEVASEEERTAGLLVLPRSMSWQEPAVAVGQQVERKELLARGRTHIFFQANVWIFTVLSLVLGAAMGIGKAAVYKLIPDYFPHDVGVVGGIVGVIGGLGGFVMPVFFGFMLEATGLWTTCWMFFLALTLVCLVWMHMVVRRLTRQRTPEVANLIEAPQEVMA